MTLTLNMSSPTLTALFRRQIMIKNPEKFLITAGGKIKCLRCTARSSYSKLQCKRPALKSSKTHKCSSHGGLSTGPKTQAGIQRIRDAHWKHGERTKNSLELASKKSLMFLMLEELGHHANMFPSDSTRTRGRKPNGFQKLDLNDADQLATAINLSAPTIKD